MTTQANWDDYFAVKPPIDDTLIVEHGLAIWLAPWPLPDELKTEYAKVLYRRIFAIMKKAGLPTGNLKFTDPEMAVAINKARAARGSDGHVGWFSVSYTQPGSEFSMSVDNDVIQIRFGSKPLKQQVEIVRFVAENITDALLDEDLERPLQIKARAHRVEYRFDHQLELGTHKNDGTDVLNFQVMADALGLQQQPNDQTENKKITNAIPSLGIEKFIRVDYKHHALITLRGDKYNMFLGMKAPWNVTQRRLDISAHLRMEEEFGLDIPKALDWTVSWFDFYRDIVVQRFLSNLLTYANATYKE